MSSEVVDQQVEKIYNEGVKRGFELAILQDTEEKTSNKVVAHSCAECKYSGTGICHAYDNYQSIIRGRYPIECPAFVQKPAPIGFFRWIWRLIW